MKAAPAIDRSCRKATAWRGNFEEPSFIAPISWPQSHRDSWPSFRKFAVLGRRRSRLAGGPRRGLSSQHKQKENNRKQSQKQAEPVEEVAFGGGRRKGEAQPIGRGSVRERGSKYVENLGGAETI